MTKSFIFDAGNVLLRWAPLEVVQATVTDAGQHQRYLHSIFLHQRWLDLDAGRIDECAAVPEFAASLGIDTCEIDRILYAARESLVPLAPGVALLKELGSLGCDLTCLTNMSRETYAHVRPKFAFWESFRGIVVSGHVRMAKPDPAIFRHIVEHLNLVPSETLFIDDLPANVEAARSIGLAAIVYDGSPECLEKIRALAVN